MRHRQSTDRLRSLNPQLETVGRPDAYLAGVPAVDVGEEVGFAVYVEAHFAGGTDGGDDGVGDDLVAGEVEVAGVGSGAAWVHGDVATFVGCFGVDGGDVE